MDTSHLCVYLREHAGIRVGPATGVYLHRKIQDEGTATVALMGGDARTGIAMRSVIATDAIRKKIRAAATDDYPQTGE